PTRHRPNVRLTFTASDCQPYHQRIRRSDLRHPCAFPIALLAMFALPLQIAIADVPAPQVQSTPVATGQGYFPVACRLQDGRIAVVMRGGAPHIGIKGRLDISFSPDEGKTWSKPDRK